MPRTLKDGGRDELEAVIRVVIEAIEASEDNGRFFDAAYGALSIAGSLGMICQCYKEHLYLQPLLDCAVLTIKQAGEKFRGPCTHGAT